MLSELFSISNIAFTVPLAGFGTDHYNVSWLELWSTILGLAAVIGARLNKVWWYPLGIANSVGFIAIFYQINMYSDLLLNFYFIVISFLGWWMWVQKDKTGAEAFPIRRLGSLGQTVLLLFVVGGTILLGQNIDVVFSSMASVVASATQTTYTHIPAALPYWDASTTVMSVAAMYLLAKRYVESWVLWVVVDIICIGLYMYKGVIAMAAEYFIFLLNAILALYQWDRFAKRKEIPNGTVAIN